MNTPTIMTKAVETSQISFNQILTDLTENFLEILYLQFFHIFWSPFHIPNELFLNKLTPQLILENRSKDILVLSLIIYLFAKLELNLNQKI